jgi:hypothetical protein
MMQGSLKLNEMKSSYYRIEKKEGPFAMVLTSKIMDRVEIKSR